MSLCGSKAPLPKKEYGQYAARVNMLGAKLFYTRAGLRLVTHGLDIDEPRPQAICLICPSLSK